MQVHSPCIWQLQKKQNPSLVFESCCKQKHNLKPSQGPVSHSPKIHPSSIPIQPCAKSWNSVKTSKHNESHRKKLAERESIDVAGAGVHKTPGLTSEAHCQLGRQSAAWQETLSVDVDVKLFLSLISALTSRNLTLFRMKTVSSSDTQVGWFS